jgi:hypothetical protein
MEYADPRAMVPASKRLATWPYGDLADMVGATRSHVSFFMTKFRKLGFIDYNGGHFSARIVVDPHDDPSKMA